MRKFIDTAVLLFLLLAPAALLVGADKYMNEKDETVTEATVEEEETVTADTTIAKWDDKEYASNSPRP